MGSNAADNKLYAINPDGTFKWSYITTSGIAGPPAIGPDGTIYAIDDSAILYAINSNGGLKWSQAGYQMSAWVGPLPPSRCVAINGAGKIFAPHDKQIYALNPDGSLIWQSGLLDWQITAPPVRAQGITYVGDNNKIYAIDDVNGTILWSYSSPAAGMLYGIIVGNDTSVYCVERYCIYKLKPDSDAGAEEDGKEQSFTVSFANPARNRVAISYTLPVSGQVRIKIHDNAGRLIKTLNEGYQKAGLHRVSWNMMTDHGTKARSGVYFYEFLFNSKKETGKIVILQN